jgi:hypothetical protein
MRRSVPLLVAAVGVVVACASSPGDDDRVKATGPDVTSFKNDVNAVLERRCATLDCHGQTGRALRFYSLNGLRLPNDAGLTPGNGATSQDEIKANYTSIISLEPDKMAEVVKAKASGDPLQLLLMRKALNVDNAHKGGPAMFKGDDAELCVSGWIKGQLRAPECARAARPF